MLTVTTLRVKELSEARGWNISQLARKANITYPTALSLWHDRVEQLNRKTLDRVALALGVNVGDLFGGEPDPAALNDEA